MAVELAVPIAVAAYLILSGQEPECPEFIWTDEAGIEWTEEVCWTAGEATGWAGHERFESPVSGAVPEPATWAVMILGFGLAGWGLRRSRAALHAPLNRVSDDLGTAGSVSLRGGIDLRKKVFRQANPNQRIASRGGSAALFRLNRNFLPPPSDKRYSRKAIWEQPK